jgi:hypothetical protein
MAIGLIFNTANCTKEQYDLARNEALPDNKLAPGKLYHAAGPGGEGWCVIEVFDNKESADAHFRDALADALKKAKIAVQPTVFEIYKSLTS